MSAEKRTTSTARSTALGTELLVVAPNWLGDAVMALPALADVAATQPSGTIDVAARASVASLFALVPYVARTTVLSTSDASLQALAEPRYGTALLLPNSFNAARLARQAGIAERWGYATDLRSVLLTRAIRPPARVHQVEYYRHLVERLGFDRRADVPRLVVDDTLAGDGRRLLEAEGWDGRSPVVAMAPGAAFGGAKRWPAAAFAELGAGLDREGARIVLVGSAADKSAAAEVAQAASVRGRVIDLAGRTTLPLLAAVLAHSRALVTNDSGAMHFAAALGVPVTALFGPTRERETHPVGPAPHVVLTNPVWCRPCMLRECPLTQRCMTGIGAEQALTATRRFLNG